MKIKTELSIGKATKSFGVSSVFVSFVLLRGCRAQGALPQLVGKGLPQPPVSGSLYPGITWIVQLRPALDLGDHCLRFPLSAEEETEYRRASVIFLRPTAG